jgi:RNA polymerase sigma factor for flagellar operon FliA
MSSNPPETDVAAFFLETLPLIEQTIRFICRRHHCRPDEAEDFGSLARLRLIEDDYAVLRKFGRRSSLRTYLVVVLGRVFLDYRRQRWGVWRPSAEARRLGPTAVRLDVLLYRDGLSLDEAVEVLRTNERVAAPPAELRELAARLPRRVHRRIEGDEALAKLSVPDAIEQRALRSEGEARARSLREALQAARAELPAEDALILRLRFQDDFTVARIAQTLGLQAKPLYRRIGRLLQDLRARLEARGFTSGDLYEALGLSAWDDDEEGAA